MISVRLLFLVTFVAIFVSYYFLLTVPQIVNIFFEELLTLGIVFIIYLIYFFMKLKLKNKTIYQLIPKNTYLPIQQTVLIFLALQVVDYYFEDGFIGMISLWWMYWLFGIGIYLLTDIINFYKNFTMNKNK